MESTITSKSRPMSKQVSESYSVSDLAFDNHIKQRQGQNFKGALKRAMHMNKVVINPEKFTTEKIINMLSIEKLTQLQK